MSIGRSLLVLAGVAVLAAIVTGFWMFGEREARAGGACSQVGYQLSAEGEDGGTEASFELQSGAPGEEWLVSLRRADTVLVEGTRLTDEDAEIDVDAWVPDDGGSFTADFTRVVDDLSCTATVRR